MTKQIRIEKRENTVESGTRLACLNVRNQATSFQASSALSLVAAVATSTARSTVFIVITRLGMPFCITSPKKPETSMLPNGEEGEPADEALEPGAGESGVQEP